MPEPESQDDELDLSQYLDILLRRRWIVVSAWLIVFVSTFLHTFTTQPAYQASSLLVIEKERGGSTVSADGTMIESSNEDYYQTQYKLLKSASLLQQVYDKLHLENTDDFRQPHGLQKLENSITVAPILRSRLVYVKADSHDPKLAAQISDTVSQAFVDQNLSNQLFISKEVLEALRIRQDNPDAERAYGALPAVVNNTLIQTLKAEYAKLQAQYADLSAKYTTKHPAMLALKANMTALDGQIKIETEKIVQSLKTELSGQLKGNNVRIIDNATIPEKPFKPRKLTALMLGFMGGLLVGFLAAMLIEMLDQSVRTQEDVENKLSLPFLGAIPFLAQQSREKVYHPLLSKELSLTSEAFRNLRTMVDFASVAEKSGAFLITSTMQEEGKSYLACNMAVAFSQVGDKVLLIDGDLRRPKVHNNLQLSCQRGLSDYLASSRSIDELPEMLQILPELPNLKILVCGTRPPNPSELLNTPKLSALVAWARGNYDRVIVDCTPMFPINDTLLWGRYIRSSIFTVRYGKTRTPLIRKACQKLETAGVKVLGTAINAAKPGGIAYAAYGYYYQQYYHQYQGQVEPSEVS